MITNEQILTAVYICNAAPEKNKAELFKGFCDELIIRLRSAEETLRTVEAESHSWVIRPETAYIIAPYMERMRSKVRAHFEKLEKK